MNLSLPPGGVLVGLGCDLVEVQRIRDVLERHGDHFLDRVFTAEERAYCMSMAQPHKHLAARWVAKEAISKTVSCCPYFRFLRPYLYGYSLCLNPMTLNYYLEDCSIYLYELNRGYR
jgi:phosphopantetheinyl transferase (holo-ACP synthase)